MENVHALQTGQGGYLRRKGLAGKKLSKPKHSHQVMEVFKAPAVKRPKTPKDDSLKVSFKSACRKLKQLSSFKQTDPSLLWEKTP